MKKIYCAKKALISLFLLTGFAGLTALCAESFRVSRVHELAVVQRVARLARYAGQGGYAVVRVGGVLLGAAGGVAAEDPV